MADVSKKVKVVELFQTCNACPAQWEGKTADGDYIYVRYRWGFLGIGLGKTFAEAVRGGVDVWAKQHGDSLDGYLPYEEMVDLTKGVVDWPKPDEVQHRVGGGYYQDSIEEKQGEKTSVPSEG